MHLDKMFVDAPLAMGGLDSPIPALSVVVGLGVEHELRRLIYSCGISCLTNGQNLVHGRRGALVLARATRFNTDVNNQLEWREI